MIGLLIEWACGRRTARGQFWSPMLADGEARRCFLVWDLEDSAVAELFRQPAARNSWPQVQPSAVRAALLDFGIGRARPAPWNCSLGEKVAAFSFYRPVSSGARGQRLGQLFRSGGAGAQLRGLFGASRSKTLAEGYCGVCVLWHFRLGDRALDPWASGRRTARGQLLVADAGRTARPAAVFCLGLGDPAVAGALRQHAAGTSQQLAAEKGSLRLYAHFCWILASAEREPLL